MVIVEMNPRVSRSSALASKATGFPIAKIAAKLAVGYRLDEIRNDITKTTPASFEPTLDYVVVKIPKWQFEKFPGADPTLGTQMKSVGEVMAIGRTFKEALWKGVRSLETGKKFGSETFDRNLIPQKLTTPTPDRLSYIRFAFESGYTVAQIHERTAIDPWFLEQIREVVAFEGEIGRATLETAPRELFSTAKRYGISDAQLAKSWGAGEMAVRERRKDLGVRAVFNRVDTCAAEFESFTPYLYSTYESACEAEPTAAQEGHDPGQRSQPHRPGHRIRLLLLPRVVRAASGGRRIDHGQLQSGDRLDGLRHERPALLRAAHARARAEHLRHREAGRRHRAVRRADAAQSRRYRSRSWACRSSGPIRKISISPRTASCSARLLDELGIPCPENGNATSVEEACEVARRIGYPVLVRPSYVLGGRAMVIAYNEETVREYMREAVTFSQERPVLIDRFLEDAMEIDVDALADTEDVLIAGIMEHIEEAGVHSGDSSCVLPAMSLTPADVSTIEEYTVRLALALRVVGLMNVQYAIKDGVVYVLEVNPRASRTVPYVSKATGVALPKVAVGLMLGRKLRDLTHLTHGLASGRLPVPQSFVKSPVFPFNKFPGVDPALGPEMRSTGEVMGVGESFGEAFAKAQLSAGTPLPASGTVFITVTDRYKAEAVQVARRFAELGFNLMATRGTAAAIEAAGLRCKVVFKVNEGRPNAVDQLKAGAIHLVIYTATGALSFSDEKAIRRGAILFRVPCITTLSGARAAVEAIAARKRGPIRVWSLQQIHEAKRTAV